MAIIFQKGGMSDLTLERGRVFPIEEPIQINQERRMTEAYNPKVVAYSSSMQLIKMVFEGLSRDNYDGAVNGLKTWFSDSAINWSENNFTMVNEDGSTKTIRLWQDDFDMPTTGPNRYRIELLFIDET